MENNLVKIYRSKKSVLSINDLAILMSERNGDNLKAKIYYYVKKGYLSRLRRGFYIKDKEFNERELATKIFTPSYISFETVLAQEGMTFQYYSSIFVASYLSRDIKVGDQRISYRKMKKSVLLNRAGLVNKGPYFEATMERAFLDTIYLQGEIYFDNVDNLDWNKVFELVKIYKNKDMERRVKKMRGKYD